MGSVFFFFFTESVTQWPFIKCEFQISADISLKENFHSACERRTFFLLQVKPFALSTHYHPATWDYTTERQHAVDSPGFNMALLPRGM